MTKVVNGKKYSTETATLIGETGYSYPGDLQWWSEALYVKQNGEFFVCGEGGAMSLYCQQVSANEWTGSSVITPISEDEARVWAEENIDYETYVKFFGDVEE